MTKVEVEGVELTGEVAGLVDFEVTCEVAGVVVEGGEKMWQFV